MNPSIFEPIISATILSFRFVSIPRISSLESSLGKKSVTLSRLPESIFFLKSVALTPEPGPAASANP